VAYSTGEFADTIDDLIEGDDLMKRDDLIKVI